MSRFALLVSVCLWAGCSATDLPSDHLDSSASSSSAAASASASSASSSAGSTSSGSSSSSSSSTSTSSSSSSTSASSSSGSSGTTNGGTSGGPFCEVPVRPAIDNGDIGQPCTPSADGTPIQSDCAAGELCLYPWGNKAMCTKPCGFDPGVCAGSTQCAPFAFDANFYCLPGCDWSSGGACPSGQICQASSTDPARLGYCMAPCAASVDCGRAANGMAYKTCQGGTCRCASDVACQNVYGNLTARCDGLSGLCYDPCTGNATCADNEGCCEPGTDGHPSACRYGGEGTLAFCEPCSSNAQCQSGFCDVGNTNTCNTADPCSDLECSVMGKTCDSISSNCSCP